MFFCTWISLGSGLICILTIVSIIFWELLNPFGRFIWAPELCLWHIPGNPETGQQTELPRHKFSRAHGDHICKPHRRRWYGSKRKAFNLHHHLVLQGKLTTSICDLAGMTLWHHWLFNRKQKLTDCSVQFNVLLLPQSFHHSFQVEQSLFLPISLLSVVSGCVSLGIHESKWNPCL